MEWLLEQLEAAKDVVHSYTCVSCEIATAQDIVMVVEDTPQGAHVVVVGICDTCSGQREDPSVGEKGA